MTSNTKIKLRQCVKNRWRICTAPEDVYILTCKHRNKSKLDICIYAITKAFYDLIN